MMKIAEERKKVYNGWTVFLLGIGSGKVFSFYVANGYLALASYFNLFITSKIN